MSTETWSGSTNTALHGTAELNSCHGTSSGSYLIAAVIPIKLLAGIGGRHAVIKHAIS